MFAGIGGNRLFWDEVTQINVTAVEKNPQIASIYQKRFPQDEVITGDAFEYLRENYQKFEFIWASPPCQSHSSMMKFHPSVPKIPRVDEIYGLTIWLNHYYSSFYCIENVQPYYKILIPPSARIERHYFWSNFHIRKVRREIRYGGQNKIGGIINETYEELIQKNHLDDIKDDLLALPKTQQVMRNCVKPEIGKYILRELLASKRMKLENYLVL